MSISKERLLKIREYIKNNYDPNDNTQVILVNHQSDSSVQYGLYDNFEDLQKRVENRLEETWQEAVFNIINQKLMDGLEVYKRAELSKATFSKIRNNKNYRPDKDTAVRLCIGLKLNLDETLDLLAKAGFTLSKSIPRDLVVRCFIEEREYDLYDIDAALEDLNLMPFMEDGDEQERNITN